MPIKPMTAANLMTSDASAHDCKTSMAAESHLGVKRAGAIHGMIIEEIDHQQLHGISDESHINSGTDKKESIQLTHYREIVECIWAAVISDVIPEYTKPLTKKELTRLSDVRRRVGEPLFQRIVWAVIRRWDQWVLEDDRGMPCTADPGRPPIQYLIRYVEVTGFELKDRGDISDETLEAYMDWLNSGPGDDVPYPL